MAEEAVGRTEHRIRLVDEDGRPVARGVVALARSSVPFPEIALLTDEDGFVQLRLPPGVFVFRARGPGGSAADVEVTSPGPMDRVVRLKAG